MRRKIEDSDEDDDVSADDDDDDGDVAMEVQEEEEEEQEEKGKKKKKKNVVDDINLAQYKTFPKTSDVNLSLVDVKGWSLIHHLVSPLKDATYDNVAILKLLSDARAPLDIKDKQGLTPLDHALSCDSSAPKLARALQKLMGIKKTQWAQPMTTTTITTTPAPRAPLSDGIIWSASSAVPASSAPHFSADAEALVKKFEEKWLREEEEEEKGEEEKERLRPDEKLEMRETGEIEMDADSGLLYDAVLTKTDVQGNSGWGVFNFYVLQLVRHKARELWVLFTRWGHIGTEGQYQRTPFGRKEDGIKEFLKIFKAKTGNDWKDIASFEGKPKKYTLVDPKERQRKRRLRAIKLKLNSTVPSRLPPPLQDLMEELMDLGMLHSAYREVKVDTGAIPFTRMRKETISQAVTMLNTLRPIVEEMEDMRKENPSSGIDVQKYLEKYREVVRISNSIHHILPEKGGYAFHNIQVLQTTELIDDCIERLVSLVQMEVASRITAGAMLRRSEVNPAEYVYRAIGATLRPLDPDETEAQYLVKYITTGLQVHDPTNRKRYNIYSHNQRPSRIESIFVVERPGEAARINALNMDNHILLFHGTRTANLISILHRGLLVAPPGAMISGHLHGKGVYFANMFDKSVGYTGSWQHFGGQKHRKTKKYILVCEVALGDVMITPYSQELGAFNSKLVPGRLAPRANMDARMRDGCVIPLGDLTERKTKARCYMPDYSEYIVYNPDQIRIRYLVQFT